MGPEFECGNAGNGTAMRKLPQPQPQFTAVALNDPTSPIRPNAIWICRANQNAALTQAATNYTQALDPPKNPKAQALEPLTSRQTRNTRSSG